MTITKSQQDLWDKSIEYWKDRELLHDKINQKDYEKIQKQLKATYISAKKELQKELAYLYANEGISASDEFHVNNTLSAIDKVLNDISKVTEAIVSDQLSNKYKDIYNQTSLELGLNTAFDTINNETVREAVKTNWSGLTFSERIWEHRDNLKSQIKEEIKKGMIRGDSLQDISKRLAEKLNNSFANAMRLIRTETCWVQTKATLDSFKASGVVKQYEFSAFLDKRTSPQCRQLDGTIIKLEEGKAGLNMPPLHPNCRSCILPVIEELKSIADTSGIPTERSELLSYLEQELKIFTSNVDVIDTNILRGIAEFNQKMQSTYPGLYTLSNNKFFNVTKLNVNNNYPGAYAYHSLGSNIITLSEKYFKDSKKLIPQLISDMQKNWSPKVDKDKIGQYIYVHEYGHYINTIMTQKNINDYEKYAREIRNKAMKKFKEDTGKKMLVADIQRELCKYAGKAPSETFAEAFAEYMLNSNPRPFAKAFGQILEAELRRFK